MGAGVGLLRRALAKHGGTKDAFAKEVLGRGRSTLNRWERSVKGGGTPIPRNVIILLRVYLRPEEAK